MSYRAGYIGLIGQPNAGKSSLLNFLVKEKVSIVSEKPQTTRRRVMGIWNHNNGQVVFVDAPGILTQGKGLNQFLEQEAIEVSRDSDALLAILALDTATPEHVEKVLDLVKEQQKPWRALVTKIDLHGFEHRLMRMQQMILDRGGQFHTLSLKAASETDREIILEDLLQLLPETPKPLFAEDIYTPHSLRDLVAEIIREKCFENLHQEIPYQLSVRVIKFDEEAASGPRIAAEILVAKENHKPIVIGKAGAVLKAIGTQSRKDIEKLMGQKIFLQLHVTVEPDWFKNKRIMKELGYVHEE